MLDFFKGKRVLITGHTGFKGSWLSRALVLAGAKVSGYALEPDNRENMYDLLNIKKDMNSVIGDVRNLEKLKETFKNTKPDFAIHMAAQPLVRESYLNPVYTYETNVLGTVNFLECVRTLMDGGSVLNVTTDKVYDNKEWERAYVEDDYLDGYDPYSNSKSCSELVTHSYKRSFLDEAGFALSTARAGNVIGGGDFAHNRIVPDCFRAAKAKETLIIRNPSSIRPYQHVLEPLAIYLEILKAQQEDKSKASSYNVGPDEEDCVTTESLVKLFAKYWRDGFTYEIKKDKGPHEANLLKLNCDKLKRVFDWKPKYNIEKTVKETVNWYKAYSEGENMLEVTDRQIQEFFD